MSPPLFLPVPREVRRSYQIAIIGAGVQGLATAYYLARAGCTGIAVFDRAYLGSGASGRNHTAIRASFASESWTRFFALAREMFEHISEELEWNVMFTKRGYCLCFQDPSFASRAQQMLALHRRFGVKTELVDERTLTRLLPGVRTDLFAGALYHPYLGISRHDAVVWGLAQAVTRLGVDVHTNTAITDIVLKDDAVSGVLSERGSAAVDVVVNAAGAQSGEVNAMIGVDSPSYPMLLESIVTEPYEPMLDPMVAMLEPHTYLHQTSRGEFVCGAEDEGMSPPAQLVVTYGGIKHIASQVVHFFPKLAGARLLRVWGGLVDASPDGAGLVGEVPGRPGYYVTIGWGGYGYMACLASGRLLADQIVTGVMPDVLRPFRFGRVAEGESAADALLVGGIPS